MLTVWYFLFFIFFSLLKSYILIVVCRRAHVLFTLFVGFFWRTVVSNTYCVVFIVLFVLYSVYQMLPVSLDCPFLIVPSVFSNVYLIRRDWRRSSKRQFDRLPAGKSYDFMVFLTRGEHTNYNYIRVYSTTCKDFYRF